MDVITLTCPETEDSIASPMNVVDDEEDDLLGQGSPTLSLELEEREVQSLLDSPTPSPSASPPPPAPQPSPSYASSDLRDRMTAEQLAAKKQKSKEAKRQKKALQPLNINWSKDKEAEEAAA